MLSITRGKAFSSLPEEDKKGAEIFLRYTREVLCSNNKDVMLIYAKELKIMLVLY